MASTGSTSTKWNMFTSMAVGGILAVVEAAVESTAGLASTSESLSEEVDCLDDDDSTRDWLRLREVV